MLSVQFGAVHRSAGSFICRAGIAPALLSYQHAPHFEEDLLFSAADLHLGGAEPGGGGGLGLAGEVAQLDQLSVLVAERLQRLAEREPVR